MLNCKLFLVLILAYQQVYCHDCPQGTDPLTHMCYKIIAAKSDYKDALLKCIGQRLDLIPVQKLRHFIRENKRDLPESWRGLYRVNAIKVTNDGTWYQYVNKKLSKINFSNYPTFNTSRGRVGDTLLWYPSTNGLYPISFKANSISKFWLMPLCFTPREASKACEGLKKDCCDNGDCIMGQCRCYHGWSSDQNCCCRDTSITLTLIEAKTNRRVMNAVAKIVDGNVNKVVDMTDAMGRLTVDGCKAKFEGQAKVSVDGYCAQPLSLPTPLIGHVKINVYLSKAAELTLFVAHGLNMEPIEGASVVVAGMMKQTDKSGVIVVDKCAGETLMYQATANGYCPLEMTEVTLMPGCNDILVPLRPTTDLQIDVKDATSCNPLSGIEVTVTSSSGENKTHLSQPNGKINIEECVLSTIDSFVNINNYCMAQTNVNLYKISGLNQAELVLKPHTSLTVKVLDQNNVPVPTATVTLTTETSVESGRTNFYGRRTFVDLCYSDKIGIEVFTGPFSTRKCQPKTIETIVASTDLMEVKTICT